MSVLIHMTSPDSHSYFNNALVIGPPQINFWTAAEATTAYGYLSIDILGCTTAEDFAADMASGALLECLRDIPLPDFREAMAEGGAVFKSIALGSNRLTQVEQLFAPNIDGVVITENPREVFKAKRLGLPPFNQILARIK